MADKKEDKGNAPKLDETNTPRHKLIAMGQTPKVAEPSPKTPE